MTGIVNALSVDVEDYFQVSAFRDVVAYESWEGFDRRVETNTRRLMDLFDRAGVKATFFVLGWIAERHPELVRDLHACGHEVASHGYAHRTLDSVSPREFREEIRQQKSLLEALIQAPIIGYRAPSFSITNKTLWALEVLAEEGFLYDSSIFPIHHDRYGIPSAPRFPHDVQYGGLTLREFPMSTISCWRGMNIPFGGGGYLRLFPLWVTDRGVRRLNRTGYPAMVYVHPWEIDPDQPRVNGHWLSRFRHYRNLNLTCRRLDVLLNRYAWSSIRNVLNLGRHAASENRFQPSPPPSALVAELQPTPTIGGPTVKVGLLQDHEASRWDEYVGARRTASNYHRLAWRRVIKESFGHRTYYLVAKDDEGTFVGILPLVYVKSWLFGKYLVSMPFLNYGGIVADTREAYRALLATAMELTEQLKARHLELRHDRPLDCHLAVKTHKVSMVLDLPPSPDTLWKSFSSKLRSQIRRPMKEGMEVLWGGLDQFDAFYRVFSIHMRDLGTPVYGEGFFRSMIEVLREDVRVCVVSHRGTPVAAGFLIRHKGTMEIPWAAALRDYQSLSPNMLLYWSVLKEACETGVTRFDFGRSTVDSGTYRFKAQWGARPIALYWYYAVAPGKPLPELNPNNPKYQRAIGLWQRLPVWVARQVGPAVIRGIA